MNGLFALVAAAALLFAFGCPASPLPGASQQGAQAPGAPAPSSAYYGDGADAHGCRGQDGYFWCKVKGRCIDIRAEKCQYEPPPSGITGVSAEACATANGAVADSGACPEGTYSAAGILDSGMQGKVCCRPGEQAST